MPVEQLSLDDYVAREEGRNKPKPGQLPTPPGTSGYGPVGQMASDVFSPAPPGVDWRVLTPTNLLRGLRQGIVSDEDIAEIKRNPYGLTAAATAVNVGIALSRGAGRGENLGWRIVPIKEWNAMKTPEGMHETVKVDDAGNHYKASGTHEVQNPDGTSTSHVIANPVPGPPAGPETVTDEHGAVWIKGSPEWFQQKAIDFQKKHGLPPPDAPYPDSEMGKKYPGKTWSEIYKSLDIPPPDTLSEQGKKAWPNWNAETKQTYLDAMKSAEKGFPQPGDPKPEDFGALGTGPTKQWNELSPEIQKWFKEKYGIKSDELAWKKWNDSLTPPGKKPPMTEKEAYDYLQEPSKLTPEQQDQVMKDFFEKNTKDFQDLVDKMPLKKDEQPSGPLPDWLKSQGYPGEVGPVDWNWYTPKGSEGPLELPPGWPPEDMGAHTSDFWDRFGWKPPPDPNSPDFPGPNRWDYQPPPE